MMLRTQVSWCSSYRSTSEHLLDPYNTISLHLPTCNYTSPDGWKWNVPSQCPRLTKEFSTNGVSVTKISNSSRSAANVGDAISMVSDDVEKYNAMAILGGVVDFQRIPNGIYSSAITTDNNSNKAASGLFLLHQRICMSVTFFNGFKKFSDVR